MPPFRTFLRPTARLSLWEYQASFPAAVLAKAEAWADGAARQKGTESMMTRRIGLVIGPDFDFMGLAVTSPFVVANRYAGTALYDVHLLSERGGPIRSGLGPDVATEPLGDPAGFDTLLVAAGIGIPQTSPILADHLRAAARSTRRVAGLCLGAFMLGDAGLLDGRRATTHWHFAPQFRARYPACQLDIDKIYVVDDTIWTSAGMSAAIDLAVGMIERDHGRDLAVSVARGLVMERRRAGGQAQHSAFLDLDARTDRTQAVLAYARRNLHLPLTTEALAAVSLPQPAPVHPAVPGGDRHLAVQGGGAPPPGSGEADAGAEPPADRGDRARDGFCQPRADAPGIPAGLRRGAAQRPHRGGSRRRPVTGKAGGPVQSAENVRNHDVNVRIRRCLSRLMV